MPEVRVSSAKTKSTSFNTRTALNVMSSMFPTGVGTIYRIPIAFTKIDKLLSYTKKTQYLLHFLNRLCTFAVIWQIYLQVRTIVLVG